MITTVPLHDRRPRLTILLLMGYGLTVTEPIPAKGEHRHVSLSTSIKVATHHQLTARAPTRSAAGPENVQPDLAYVLVGLVGRQIGQVLTGQPGEVMRFACPDGVPGQLTGPSSPAPGAGGGSRGGWPAPTSV